MTLELILNGEMVDVMVYDRAHNEVYSLVLNPNVHTFNFGSNKHNEMVRSCDKVLKVYDGVVSFIENLKQLGMNTGDIQDKVMELCKADRLYRPLRYKKYEDVDFEMIKKYAIYETL